jgi:hypothetical protein
MNCETLRRLARHLQSAQCCDPRNLPQRTRGFDTVTRRKQRRDLLPSEYSAIIPDLRILSLGNSELIRDAFAVTVAVRRFSPLCASLSRQLITMHG